ncbi:hypothetical protein HK405_014234, partial [Cladochytrium tenue]
MSAADGTPTNGDLLALSVAVASTADPRDGLAAVEAAAAAIAGANATADIFTSSAAASDATASAFSRIAATHPSVSPVVRASPAVRLLWADCALRMGDLGSAKAAVLSVLAESPDEPTATTLLAELALLGADPASDDADPTGRARAILAPALDALQTSTTATIFDSVEAISPTAIARALTLQKRIGLLRALRSVADFARDRGDLDAAEAAYSRCVDDDDPRRPGVLRAMALAERAAIRLHLNKPDLASDDCTAAIDLLRRLETASALSLPSLSLPAAAASSSSTADDVTPVAHSTSTSTPPPHDARASPRAALLRELLLRRAACSDRLRRHHASVADYRAAVRIRRDPPAVAALLRAEATARAAAVPDWYAVLGVAADADTPTLRKAYRALARDLHP